MSSLLDESNPTLSGREGGRERKREGGRERGREGGREGEREGGREGGSSLPPWIVNDTQLPQLSVHEQLGA